MSISTRSKLSSRTFRLAAFGAAFGALTALTPAVANAQTPAAGQQQERRQDAAREDQRREAAAQDLRRDITSRTQGAFGPAGQAASGRPADVGGFSPNGFVAPDGRIQSSPSVPAGSGARN